MARAGLRRADGVFCFATTQFGAAFPLILRTVSACAETRAVVGCSASGVIAPEIEVESGAAVSVLVFAGQSLSVKRFFAPGLRGDNDRIVREVADSLRPVLAPHNSHNLMTLFPDTYNADAQALIAGLSRELPGISIIGGGATEDGSAGETFQFCGDVVSSNSVAGMLIGGEFDLNVGASLACTPLGALRQVTAAEDNLLIELDGRPALEIFTESAGILAEDLRRAAAFVFLGIPADSHDSSLEHGRYSVRNLVGFDKQHGIVAVAHRPQIGDNVAFVLRDGERARQELKATLEEMKARAKVPPAFGLYFNCVSRGSNLYRIPGHDTAYIRQYLGSFPVAGFFSGFEIGPLAGATGLLQYSGVLALISEKST